MQPRHQNLNKQLHQYREHYNKDSRNNCYLQLVFSLNLHKQRQSFPNYSKRINHKYIQKEQVRNKHPYNSQSIHICRSIPDEMLPTAKLATNFEQNFFI